MRILSKKEQNQLAEMEFYTSKHLCAMFVFIGEANLLKDEIAFFSEKLLLLYNGNFEKTRKWVEKLTESINEAGKLKDEVEKMKYPCNACSYDTKCAKNKRGTCQKWKKWFRFVWRKIREQAGMKNDE